MDNTEMKMNYSYNELIIKIQEWASDRGIDNPDNIKSQTLKLVEEIGELYGSVINPDDAKVNEVFVDSIGDIQVVSIILAKQLGIDYSSISEYPVEITKSTSADYDLPEETSDHKRWQLMVYSIQIISTLGTLIESINKQKELFKIEYTLSKLYHLLWQLSTNVNINYAQALADAYSVIANRTGKMIDGTFVKSEDL